jgi:hypothetical protein
MEELGSESVDGESPAAESRVSGSDSFDATCQTNPMFGVAREPTIKTSSHSAFASMLVQFHTMAGNVGKDLWREATDLTSTDWPPKWLKVLGILWSFWLVALILWLVFAVIVPAFITIFLAMGLTASVLVSKAKWAQFLIRPVHSYLDVHSTSLPFSSVQLFSFWILFGVAFLLWSLSGSIGGRIGWAAFGIETGAMVWSETPEPSRWLATGLTAALWSLLSIAAYKKTNKTSPNKTSSNEAAPTRMNRLGRFPEFFATIERRAEQNALLHGYTDLAHYLDNNANQSRDIIATDLGIPRDRLSGLLRRRFPHGVPSPGKISPKDRREIVKAVKEGESRTAVARRYGISQSTVSKAVKDHQNRKDD